MTLLSIKHDCGHGTWLPCRIVVVRPAFRFFFLSVGAHATCADDAGDLSTAKTVGERASETAKGGSKTGRRVLHATSPGRGVGCRSGALAAPPATAVLPSGSTIIYDQILR